MVEDDKLTEVAKTDFKIRAVAGFIFGIVAALASIVFIIVSIVNKNTEFIIPLIIMVLVGLGVSASCGYFLFRKEKKETVEEKQE
jgi:hypothetical protein